MSARVERRIGEVIGGKYRLVRFLAAGGMGVVYEAQHTVVKRRFAVKFLRPELAEKRESLARFQREAQAAGALESEHLAAAVDFGVASDASSFIVMEYLDGESLEALLERSGPLPLERATDLVHQACRGMQAAHAANIVHRDLKPQNLFLCRREDGTDLLKVLDFGIAKLEASDQNSTATLTGTVLGTPAYMSPEQARGEKAIDHRADVYALGAILYELLSGRKPHPGDSHNAILHHIATQPPVPLDFVEPPLPASLVEAIERALSSEPSGRFASTELFARAIADFAERKGWPAPERASPSSPREASDPTELAPLALERAAAPMLEPMAARRDGAARKRAVILLATIALAFGLWLAAKTPPDGAGQATAAPAGPAPVAPTPPPTPATEPAERPLPAAATGEPTLAASVERIAETPASRATRSKPENRAAPPAAPAPPPKAATSAAPLAFDRQNPYDSTQ